MKIILKYKAEIALLSDSLIQFNSEFETAVSKLKDKNSGLHNWVDEELTEVELLHSLSLIK